MSNLTIHIKLQNNNKIGLQEVLSFFGKWLDIFNFKVALGLSQHFFNEHDYRNIISMLKLSNFPK